jgi:hypothetical protein
VDGGEVCQSSEEKSEEGGEKIVTISRAKGSLTFSANFQLIVTMNSWINLFNNSH